MFLDLAVVLWLWCWELVLWSEVKGASPLGFGSADPVSLVRDHSVKQGLVEHGVSVHSWNGDLLNEPWEVYDHKGQAFTTFDAYWEKCLHMPYEPEAPLLPPRQLRGLKCTTFLGVFF